MNKSATLNAGVYRIRPLKNNVISTYLFQYLNAPFLLNFALKQSSGGTIKHLNQSQIINFKIPLPTTNEQNKISCFLNLIDNKIETLEAKISTLKKYKEGLLNLLIKSTDEFVALKQLATLYQPKNLSKDKFNINGKYYVYGANGIIGKSDFYNHEKEEIVIGCRGNCNSVILTNKKSWINSNAMVVLPNDKIKKMELYYMMQTISFRKYIEGSGVPQITREKAKLIQVPFLKHNEQIFHVLANIDEIILNHNNIYEQLFKIKKNLLLNLFI